MAEKDFIGFTFDNIHSDDLGILRVSDGDRYKEDLQPEIKDLTAEVPGMHGEYYFGSTYGNKEFDIDIAYDSLTETQFRKLRRLFSGREIHELIFDERPYKKYLVKLANPIELSYACFDEPEKEEVPFDGVYGPTTVLRPTGRTQRTYKGDGTISFIAYYPFAKANFKILPIGYKKTTEIVAGKKYYVYNEGYGYQKVQNPVIGNIGTYYERYTTTDSEEWADSSGLLTFDVYDDFDNYELLSEGIYGFRIYNPGDMDTGFRLYFDKTFLQNKSQIILRYRINDVDDEPDEFIFNVPELKGEGANKDKGILIDTNSRLIIGISEVPVWTRELAPTYTTSQYIYNECIESGYFFKFTTNLSTSNLQSTLEVESTIVAEATAANEIRNPEIFYDYLYF